MVWSRFASIHSCSVPEPSEWSYCWGAIRPLHCVVCATNTLPIRCVVCATKYNGGKASGSDFRIEVFAYKGEILFRTHTYLASMLLSRQLAHRKELHHVSVHIPQQRIHADIQANPNHWVSQVLGPAVSSGFEDSHAHKFFFDLGFPA